MLATVLVLGAAKAIGVITFPGLDRSIPNKVIRRFLSISAAYYYNLLYIYILLLTFPDAPYNPSFKLKGAQFYSLNGPSVALTLHTT
jgi:hypothetical protein